MNKVTAVEVGELVESAKSIVVIQGDNPDADSLGSALALEEIFGDQGKTVSLYCGVQIPRHLTYLSGWDRVVSDLTAQFDLAIIVDTSASALLERVSRPELKSRFRERPVLVIDHHDADCDIDFATHVWNQSAVATAEVIYELALSLKWPLNSVAKENIAAAMLSDSMGLTSEALSARGVYILAELVETGVSLAKIEQRRRAAGRKSPELLEYKGRLLQRIEYFAQGRLASITIPWNEIEKYSPIYNPPMLVLDEMRSVEGVQAAIAFKHYNNGRITGKIRCNVGFGIASELAKQFGGGGHAYAAGFKITDGRNLENVKTQVMSAAEVLLDKFPAGKA